MDGIVILSDDYKKQMKENEEKNVPKNKEKRLQMKMLYMKNLEVHHIM